MGRERYNNDHRFRTFASKNKICIAPLETQPTTVTFHTATWLDQKMQALNSRALAIGRLDQIHWRFFLKKMERGTLIRFFCWVFLFEREGNISVWCLIFFMISVFLLLVHSVWLSWKCNQSTLSWKRRAPNFQQRVWKQKGTKNGLCNPTTTQKKKFFANSYVIAFRKNCTNAGQCARHCRQVFKKHCEQDSLF